MSASRRGRWLVALMVLAFVALACAPAALALFSGSAVGGAESVASGKLSSPSNVAAIQVDCRSYKSVEVSVTWTGSSSSYVTSYTIERSTTDKRPLHDGGERVG